jgi:parallel beta-helix repeat protein
MMNDNSHPTVTDCTFSGNFSGNLAWRGGGIRNHSSSPTVTDCRFQGNTAYGGNGGGMFNDQSSPTITDSLFCENAPDDIWGDWDGDDNTFYTFCRQFGFDTIDVGMDDVLNLLGPGGGLAMDFRRFVTQVVVCVAVLSSAAQADTIYVDDDNCPGPGSGTEGDPYCSIQTAIDNAVDTDEIVVAPGTYFETINFMGKAVWLHSSDGPKVTIIDAQGLGTVVTCESGEGPDTVLQGFTITASNGGGGGMSNFGSSPTVIDCRFVGNTSAFGGGMFNVNGSSPTVTNCTFSGNTALIWGGGMFNNGSSPTVTNCAFEGNTAGDDGGGIYNDFGSLTVTNCTFSGNDRGGMVNATSGPTVTNCTFSGNSGGGMRSGFTPTWVSNCILWGNSGFDITFFGMAHVIRFSDVGTSFGDLPASSGNINADPMFVDPDNGDFRLSPGSPCIDAGDNTVVPDGITTDLDGNPRFVDDPDTEDTGDGDPPIVDMGAYEFQIPCPWDLDGDGNVNVVDLLMVIGSWGPCAGCPADFNDDGFVNVVDLLALIGNWGPCPGVPCVWDVTGDGIVDQSDLDQVQENFGPCDGCPEDVNGDGMVNGQDAAAVARHFGPCP